MVISVTCKFSFKLSVQRVKGSGIKEEGGRNWPHLIAGW